jgi:hypothetical protein
MRTQITYLAGGYLNAGASATPSGSTEPVTGLPIATGVNVGDFIELTDEQALQFSKTTTGTLYSGLYQKVQLDSGSVTALNVGQALFWLNSAANKTFIVTGNATGNAPDLAGVVIDSTMSTTLPYAWIQVNGKANVLFDATAATAFGDIVALTGLTANTFTRQGAGTVAVTGTTAGIALAVGVASTKALVRLTRSQSKF